MWTAFDYMYRDAGNFKALGTVTLRGNLSRADRQEILDRFDHGEHFIAEQVGIPSLYEGLYRWSSGPTSADHCWHEFVGFRELSSAPDEHVLAVVEAAEFVERFRSLGEWEGNLSPHFDINCRF